MRDKLSKIGQRLSYERDKLSGAQRGSMEAVNSLVVIGAVLFIGIFVLGMIGDAMPAGGMFNETFETIEGILESSFELAAILPIVLIAGALLYYVRGFGNNGRQR